MLPIYSAMLFDPDKEDLFNDIYYRYRFQLFCVIDKILKNHHDSEDALQEAFILIAKNIHNIKDSTSQNTKGYIITIAKNTAINHLLCKSKENVCEYLEDNCENIKSSDDVAKRVENNERIKLVFDYIKTLTPKYQQILYLHYFLDLSVKEIAKMLGEKPSSVKMRLVRANKLVRKFAKGDFGNDK